MWRALRAELAYNVPWLLGGLGIAAAVSIIVSVVFFLVGDQGPPGFATAGLRAMFLIMAPMVVCFIAQSYRTEERRARLLLAGPVTPRQMAGAAVLLPVVLFAVGVLAAGLVIGVGVLVTGRLELGSLNIVGFVGGQLFAYVQMGLLAQEATAARGQRRLRVAAAGWACFLVAVLLLAVLYVSLARGLLTWSHLLVGHLLAAVIAMAASVALYARRTDFTR